MIKINLLPIRAARKREYVKQQLVLFLVVVAGLILGLITWYSTMQSKINDSKKEITRTKQKIEQYKKAIGEVEKYKGLEAELNSKLKIIEDLVKSKVGPVRVLDRLSQVIPRQVWLLSWTEKKGTVTIEGEALTNKHVAQFMTQLGETVETNPQAAPAGDKTSQTGMTFFKNIRLVETELVQDKKYAQSFVKFKISMQVSYAI